MSSPVTAIIGVGPGNGAAYAHRFAREGHKVALLSRTQSYLDALAEELDTEALGVAADASDPASVQAGLEAVKAKLGPVDNLIYNAGSGVFGSIDKVGAEDLELAWRINTLGLFAATQAVLPDMRAKGAGSIVVTGATASLRGGANFAAFAQAKAAQRSLAQSTARAVGADGVHVSLVIVDGMVDLERTRAMMPDAPAEKFMAPAAIADAVYYLTQQPRSAWTFELDLRPHIEKW